MDMSIAEATLFGELSRKISPEAIAASVRHFSTLSRATGSADGEAAARYIAEKLHEYGVACGEYSYDAYVSYPIYASVRQGGVSYKAIAAVYSGPAQDLEGELAVIGPGNLPSPYREPDPAFLSSVRGKIVLACGADAGFARVAKDAGALAVVQYQDSGEELVHHSTIGTVWGNPGLSDNGAYPFLPWVAVSRATGEALIAGAAAGGGKVALTAKMDTGIRRSMMPVATIPGAGEKFVLVSAHYDSWYEGITDNAVSDAILLEYARIFSGLSGRLGRGLVLAWWSGHSDARYAGSAWYCDHAWESLKRHCVGHINLDLAGCRNAGQIRARTTNMEGERFTADLIEKYTGRKSLPFIPMFRGADQSFWGVDIPISIMLKYEAPPEICDFTCPSGGVWWHTDQDTLDKMDPDIAIRDALINAEMICSLAVAERLPVDIDGFLARMDKELGRIPQVGDDAGFMDKARGAMRNLRGKAAWLRTDVPGRDTDDAVKAIAGGLVRVAFSGVSPYEQDSAADRNPFPLLRRAAAAADANADGVRRIFALTDLTRQKNRFLGEMDALGTLADYHRGLLSHPAGREPGGRP